MNNHEHRATVHQWLAEPLPPDVAAAIERLAGTEDVHHVAIMPDVHLSANVCIGTVVATTDRLFPNAVGGDIGCGMAAVAFDCEAEALEDEASAARVLAGLYRAVPANRHGRRDSPLPEALEQAVLSDPHLEKLKRREGYVQFGTLGRGNHFLEFQADESGRLWLMVHSGSRAIGQAIRDSHLAHAALSSTGLAYLDAEGSAGEAYLRDMQWARSYADASRRAMLHAAAELIDAVFGARRVPESLICCDHNHVRKETHFGREFWVHRKGAMPAGEDEPGIIPGSMGTRSFLVRGCGCPESLRSSSHGAGRAMSRHDARRRIPVRELDRQLRGVWYDHRLSPALREEAPSAYKDIGAVMRAQKNLTRIMHTMRPILCYKGA